MIHYNKCFTHWHDTVYLSISIGSSGARGAVALLFFLDLTESFESRSRG